MIRQMKTTGRMKSMEKNKEYNRRSAKKTRAALREAGMKYITGWIHESLHAKIMESRKTINQVIDEALREHFSEEINKKGQ